MQDSSADGTFRSGGVTIKIQIGARISLVYTRAKQGLEIKSPVKMP